MKQLLAKVLEVVRWFFGMVLALLHRVFAFLSSVNLTQRAGAVLCVAFQLAVVAACVWGFEREKSPAEPAVLPPPPAVSEPTDDATTPAVEPAAPRSDSPATSDPQHNP
jgi:hypothetical protein